MFLWLPALLLLFAVPLFVLMYQRALGKRSQSFLYYPNVTLIARTKPQLSQARRLPLFFYLAAFAVAILALARPITMLFAPDVLSGVVFAIETGRSMYNNDILPSRIEATQVAAKALLERLPDETEVGLATFSGYSSLDVPLTLDHAKVARAIETLQPGGGYAFSFGLIGALQALPQEDSEEQVGAIILFSHGHDNSGNDVLELASEAAKRGIKVHTIGVGTHGNNFSEDLLKLVAERTGGNYYPISSAQDLTDAHENLARVISLKPKAVEVSAFVSLFAAFLLIASLMLSTLQRKVI
jgi:Ca-activated chloride channel homolog